MEYEEDYWSLLEERIEKQLRSLGVAPQVAKRISAIAPSKER
jgi:hypothetical protein